MISDEEWADVLRRSSAGKYTADNIPFSATPEELSKWNMLAELERAPAKSFLPSDRDVMRAAGRFELEPRATGDFETRSCANIKEVGTWRYAEDPTTEPMCFCYRLPHYPEGEYREWYPSFPEHGVEGTPPPQDLFDWLEAGGLFEAHNVMMETAVWTRIMVPRFGWPELPRMQLRCSAAKAAAHSLPRGLEDVGRVLRTHNRKDDEGHKLMLRMCKPRKLRKAEHRALVAQGVDPSQHTYWHFSREEHERLRLYCGRDVLAEEDVSRELRDLNPLETEVFLLDQAVNERGVHVDRRSVAAALHVVERLTGGMTKELPALTGSAVDRPTQRARIVDWCHGKGVMIPDTQAITVDAWLDKRIPPEVHRVLTICREANRTSTAKYRSMEERMSFDDTLKGMLLYWGANTGRWSGAGVQPHNFPRGAIKDMALAWDVIESLDIDMMALLYGDPMELLSHATRGAFTAPPEKELAVADYSSIEARVLLWLAGETSALALMAAGGDIYCDLAAEIYKRPITKKNAEERHLGKQGILGLGFGMGAEKFIAHCLKNGVVITPDLAQFVVDIYRKKYVGVPRLWREYEAAAIEAVRSPGRTTRVGQVTWRMVGRFLFCRRPNGNMQAYCDPIVMDRETPWGAVKPSLTFMAVDALTRKWCRTSTWGGTLVENVVQGIARDLLAEAGLRAEATGIYELAFHVHDELVCYALRGKTDVRAFERLMSVLPPWATGCPVQAEGWAGHRYRK